MSDASGPSAMRADPERIEASLADLVSIPSVTGDEHLITDLVAAMVSAAGMEVETMEVPLEDINTAQGFPGTEVDRSSLPIVAGRIRGAGPGPRLMLVGHIDVVPPGDPSTWTTPAFEPDIRDGKMYGRGACDMKGGVVAALEACRLAPVQRGEVVFVAVPSEEDGGAGAFAAILNGYQADACVIPEPTDGAIITAHGGAITFTLDVPGKAAHASVRREGVSALDNLSDLVAALLADEQSRNESETDPLMRALGLPYPTIIGRVEGGNWASTVMDRVVAHGRYGVKLGQNAAEAESDLRTAIEAASAKHPFLSQHQPTVTVWGGRFDSASVPATHALPGEIADAAESVGLERPDCAGAPYGADMRLFINHGNTPTVMYGPGAVTAAHSADEFVPLDEVGRCAEVLATWITASLG